MSTTTPATTPAMTATAEDEDAFDWESCVSEQMDTYDYKQNIQTKNALAEIYLYSNSRVLQDTRQ
jgi:hypothetical protein